jgi:Domain of unknown function (DUF4190)
MTTEPGFGPSPSYAYPSAAGTNPLAIVSLACSLLGLVLLFPAIAGVICGHIARSQIRESGQHGAGMALAGLVIGYVWLILLVFVVVVFVVLLVSPTRSGT